MIEKKCLGSKPYFREHDLGIDYIFVRDDGCRCGPCMAMQLLKEGDIKGFYKIMDNYKLEEGLSVGPAIMTTHAPNVL